MTTPLFDKRSGFIMAGSAAASTLGFNGSEKLGTAVTGISQIGYSAMATTLLLGGLFGLLGNACVIVVFALNKSLHSSVNLLISSLALSNCLIALLGNPFTVASNFSGQWLFGDAGCSLYGFTVTLLGLSSMHHLSAIAVERYVIICRADLSNYVNYRMAGIMSLVCWLSALFWAAMPLVGWSSYALEGGLTSCSVKWQSSEISDISYNACIMIFSFFLPLIIMCVSYIRIFHYMVTVGISPNLEKQVSRARKNQRRVALTAFVMIVAFLASWGPYAVISLWTMIGEPEDIPPATGSCAEIIAKCAIVWNPIIYTCTNQKFRECMTDMLCCAGPRNQLQIQATLPTGLMDRRGRDTNRIQGVAGTAREVLPIDNNGQCSTSNRDNSTLSSATNFQMFVTMALPNEADNTDDFDKDATQPVYGRRECTTSNTE